MRNGNDNKTPAALAAEIEVIGAQAFGRWSRDCTWCSSQRACQGDPYACALITNELKQQRAG